MPDVVEPGTRLVQRYRLDEHLGGPSAVDGTSSATTTGGSQVKGATFWRAHDEVLDRPVGICLLHAGNSYADGVLEAARKAAVLTDARFLRVLDAAEVDGYVYVVSEWVSASTLVELVSEGPLPPSEARLLTAEIAAALAAAHEAGLDHLSLQPEHVLRTAHGQVKLAGLAIDAAARGLHVEDRGEAERRDTEGAAAVLYAALTARWPGEERTGLEPAPRDGTALCSPRQVRAGVPDDLDDVVCRALGVPGRHGGPSLNTVEELGQALAGAQVTSRLPVPGTEVRDPPPPSFGRDDEDVDGGPDRQRSRAATVAWSVVALVLVLGIGLAGWQLATTSFVTGGDDAGQQSEAENASDDGSAAPPSRLEVASATGFDPAPAGSGDENDDIATRAVDGDPDTAWNTLTYDDPFGPGGLKNGVGLLVDLGRKQKVAEVTVRLSGGPTDLQIRVAAAKGSRLGDFRRVEEATGVDRLARLRLNDVTARYVLIWLTDLPSYDSGYRGEISEVVVKG